VEPESAGDSDEAGRGAPIVFISDASAEAERLTLALRSRGYAVADVPLALLAGRVAVQHPSLVLCDADADGAIDVLGKVRDAVPELPIPVVLLGQREGAMARLESGLVAAAFARPVNVQELVGTVERLVGANREAGPPSLPPSARGNFATSSRPPARASAAPMTRAQTDVGVPPPSAAALPLPPDLSGDAVQREPGDAPIVELSRDIQQLLVDAERHLAESQPSPSSGRDEPGPEVDAEAPLPPDVLMALEEALDDEDLSEGGQTPTPHRDGTGALTGARIGVRGHTQIGGAVTGATSLGTDGTGAPVSEASYSRLDAPGPGTVVESVGGERRTGAQKAEPELDDDARRARQEASTPKPPKPNPEDLLPGASLEPGPPRASLPPPTVADNAIPEPPGGASRASAVPVRGAQQGPPPDLVRATRAEADTGARRDTTSTTPPLRRRDELSVSPGPPTDLPPAAAAALLFRDSDMPLSVSARDDGPSTNARAARDSDRPSSPRAARDSDSPPSPRATRESERPGPPRAAPKEAALKIPSALRAGDAVVTLARAIGTRHTGAIAFEVDEGIRRVVLRDGDFVTAVSGVHGESLVAFLSGRGDLPAEVARQAHKLPAFGRRAGAALIAHGHIAQDQLWLVLRAHAEWLIGRILLIERGSASLEDVGRLHDEPAVFGGATGAEVLVEMTRRAVPPEVAVERLGGPDAVMGAGPAKTLLAECALSPIETESVQRATGATVRELVGASPDVAFASALYALCALGVLSAEAAKPRPAAAPAKAVRDEIDDEALRARILARKALVDEGDYFAVLGVSREATGYDIRRAYTALRKELEPSRALTPATADLGDLLDEVVAVLDEAYQILSDQRRRDRYRRAIEATP
jgi:hypothetical protein